MTPLFSIKYRPTRFQDFDADDQAIQVLRLLMPVNVLLMGSGKTTYLNAILREYESSSSDHSNAHSNGNPNVLHINSLQEQGIGFYRNEVKLFCQTASTIAGKKKMIVLDDLDMIAEQSQQVFRNCMDKYSHNVCFIASCSNAQKVIETLQSRFVLIHLKPLSTTQMRQLLHRIATTEGMLMEPDAQEFLLTVCQHNANMLMNDMEKLHLLHQSSDPITLSLVMQTCTTISFHLFDQLTDLLHTTTTTETTKDTETTKQPETTKEPVNPLYRAIQLLYQLYDQGYSVMDILDSYFLYVKTTPKWTEDDKYAIIPLLCESITAFHTVHEDEMELALFVAKLWTITQRQRRQQHGGVG